MRQATTVAVEPTCVDAEHGPVNAAILATTLQAFPQQPLIMAGAGAHLTAVREILGPAGAGVEWREMDLPPRHMPPSRERRKLEARLWQGVFSNIVNGDTRRFLSLSSSESNLLPMKFRLWTRPSIAAVSVLHSVVGNLMASRQRKLEWWAIPPPHLRWVVLSRHIQQRVAALFPAIASRLCVLPHPLLPQAQPDPESAPVDTERVVFTFPGVATPEKGFADFCRLAESAAGIRSAKFVLAGRLSEAVPDNLLRFVEMPHSPKERMDRPSYQAALQRATYLVCPFRRDAYEFTASGSILDALIHQKPLIGYDSTACVDNLFRELGDVGYRCRNWEEMCATVTGLASRRGPDRYAEQVRNMAEGRLRYSPPMLKDRLRSMFAARSCAP